MHYFPRLALFFLCLFLVQACKCDDENTETTAETTAETNWNRSGNTVVIRTGAEPKTMNPVTAFDVNSLLALRQTLQYLHFLDPQTYEITPQLAKKEVVVQAVESGPFAGGMAYTFELFEEAAWDDGQPITAEDYIFSLKAIMNPKVASQLLGYVKIIKDVQVDPNNPKRFTVIVNEPFILAHEFITGAVPVLPAKIYDPKGLLANFQLADFLDEQRLKAIQDDPRLAEFATDFTSELHSTTPEGVVGSGPYRLAEWSATSDVTLVRKEKWWADNLKEKYPLLVAYPDTLIIQPVRDPSTAASLVRGEELDVCLMLEAKDFAEMRKEEELTKIYAFHEVEGLTSFILYLNTADPKLKDKRVRRALAHLLDVDLLIQNVFYGLADRVVGPIHFSRPYYHKDLPLLQLDIDKASELLEEAGWADSNGNGTMDKMIDGELVEMKLRLLTNATSATEQISTLMSENARKVGVEIESIPLARAGWLAAVVEGNFDLATGGFSGQPTSVDDLYQIWHTQSMPPNGFNRMHFGDEKSDALIEEIRRTLDEEKRNALYREFQALVYEEQPVIFLMAPKVRVTIHHRFEAVPTMLSPGIVPSSFKLKE